MQARFLKSKARIKLLLCANKIGKCLTYQTLIDSPYGNSKKIGEIKGKHWVWAWDGVKKVAVLADEPFKKPAEECYRVWLDNGNWFECAANHRILTSEGWKFFSDIHLSVPCLPESNSELGLLTRLEDVQHYLQRQLNYQGHCLTDSHQCGEQLPFDQDSGLTSFPLQGDAQKHNVPWSYLDGLVSKCKDSLLLFASHLSNLCGLPHLAGQPSEFLSQSDSNISEWYYGNSQVADQLSTVESFYSQLSHELKLHQDLSFSLISPDNEMQANKIVAYQPIGVNDIYDFNVPIYHNYCAAGVIHHNTCIGAIETLRFASKGSGKVIRIIGSLGFDKGIRDTIYPELKKWMPKSMLISEKRNSQGVVVNMVVKSDEGENIISLMSGEQDDMSFEGDLVDFVWIDEPPKKAIYSASLRALLISNGPMIMTFTPLSEPWVYNDIYLKAGVDPEIEIIQGSMYDATIENGGHLTLEQIENFAKRIPEEEREARIFGKFKHLIGRVYKNFQKEKHCVEPFSVPRDWPVYCAIDPHLKKENAAIWLACSPEENWYVVNEVYWKTNIEDFGREIAEVSSQYNLVSTFIDTSSETPDWTRRQTARTILSSVGVKTRLARKKNNREVARFIISQALEGKDGSGEPWLYVFKTCRRTIFEFENYVWDSKQTEDKEQPIKINDDCLDGLGYIVIEKPRYSKPRVITL